MVIAMQCSNKSIRWSSFLALLLLLLLVTDKEGTQVYFREFFLERAQFVRSVRNRVVERRANILSR